VSASFLVRSKELRDAEVEERHLRGRALQGAVVGADVPPVPARARAQRAPGLAGRRGEGRCSPSRAHGRVQVEAGCRRSHAGAARAWRLQCTPPDLKPSRAARAESPNPLRVMSASVPSERFGQPPVQPFDLTLLNDMVYSSVARHQQVLGDPSAPRSGP
jgi:hypothetical protein